MAKKPHIIIFNPDEMRADALGHLGDASAVTPYLDQFAKTEAVSFSRAYCQNPVCVPSRCSFFTGLYPHVRGHRTMSYLLQPGETTLLKELKEAGYYVWMNDRNDLTAGQISGWTESHANEIYYGGQKKRGPGPKQPNLRGDEGNKHYYSHFEGQLELSTDGKNYNGDDEVVDAAIERILSRVDDRPLCMFLGLVYPHTPYQVEEPYYSAIDKKKMPQRIRAEGCAGKPKIENLIREYAGMEAYTEEDWDELRAVYRGMCMKVDEQFARLVAALKQAKIYDDCAIFFLSDHGDYTGDYGLVEKAQNTFEDCLTRVPFLIKPPKEMTVDAGISHSLVELVDFYATAMEMAGVEPSHTHFGKNLTPVLQNRSELVRNYVHCEGGRMPGELHCDEYHSAGPNGAPKSMAYWPKMMAQTDDEAHAKGIMMFDGRYKYVSRSLGNDELYDLEVDPGEMQNKIGDTKIASVVARMQVDMLKWLQATADIVPFEYDQRFTPKMMWARVRALVPPQHEAEVKKMIEDGINFGALMTYCRELHH
ncbi:MAG: sulfatase-like hydrolase/transferase [Oscillospiraceae bacterium]